MGTRNFRIGRKVRVFSRAASISVLCLSIILLPLPGNISVAQAGQFDSQSGGNVVDTAGNGASEAVSMKTAADSANNMASGSKQMKCCKEGCDGAGKKAAADTGAENAAAKAAADGIKAPEAPSAPSQSSPGNGTTPTQSTPSGFQPMGTGWNFHTFPKSEAILCSASGSKAKMVYDLFHPQKVEAMAGCNDGMMAMAQAAMQMLSALAGLAAAAMAAKNGSKAATNASNLGPIPGAAPEAPAKIGNSDLGNQIGGASGIKIDPSILRSGKVGESFDKFEKNFGIPRDAFANSLANGGDPRQMLMNAPKNAISAEDMNMAFAAAKNMSADQRAAALAEQNAFAHELAGKIGTTGEMSAAGGAKSSTKSSKELDELDLLGADAARGVASTTSAGTAELSPELQAALAEKDAAAVREGTNIFQIVHEKYQQRVRMIYGFDAHGKSIGGKGVADANGF